LEVWSDLVNELSGTYQLTVWDFTNDLYSRNVLEIVLKEGPTSLEPRLRKVVQALDEKFYDSTYDVDEPLTGSKKTITKDESPWFYRVPIRHSKDEFTDTDIK